MRERIFKAKVQRSPTLSQHTIDRLKKVIAKREDILPEDITDAQVFESVSDYAVGTDSTFSEQVDYMTCTDFE